MYGVTDFTNNGAHVVPPGGKTCLVSTEALPAAAIAGVARSATATMDVTKRRAMRDVVFIKNDVTLCFVHSRVKQSQTTFARVSNACYSAVNIAI
jgi:hypothetical protein